MFKRFVPIFCILFSGFSWAGPLNVVATLPIFAQLARDIGGEQVQVTLLSEYPSDPHYFHLTPHQLQQLLTADYIIGPVEIIQRIPRSHAHRIDISQAYNHPNISSSALARLIQIAQQSESHDHHHHDHHHHDPNHHDPNHHDHHHDHHHDPRDSSGPCSCTHHGSANSLLSLTHEWLSFDALEILAQLLMETYKSADPAHQVLYTQRYETIIQELDQLKKDYLNKELKYKSIFYHNDCWLLEKELNKDFGPVLFHCEESGLSPKIKALLETQSQHYNAFIIDRTIPLQSLDKILNLIQCPLITIDPQGSLNYPSTVSWLYDILKILYSEP